jgi:hypothetical protein
MRRARFIHRELDAAAKALRAAEGHAAGATDPELHEALRAIRHLEEATRALYEELRDHEGHPIQRPGWPIGGHIRA